MAKLPVDLSRAARLLVPGPIALLTAEYRGKKNIMPAAWLTPVSSDPPQVVVSIFPGRYTYDLVQKSGQFALNIPPRPLAEKVKRAGSLTGEEIDKFLVLELTPFEGKQVTAPLIVECIGHLECGVITALRTGDHFLFQAEVVAASAEERAFNGDSWTLEDESVKPLHYLGGDRFAVLEKVLQI